MPVRTAAIALLGVGLVLCAISLTLERYSDPSWQKPFLVDVSNLDREALSERWHAARAEALTKRGTVENIGIGLVLLSISVVSLTAAFGTSAPGRGVQLRAPKSFLQWFGAALAAAVVFTSGFVADLFVGSVRDEFPWWADSLGISLMGVPPLLLGGAISSGLFALAVFRVAPAPHPLTVSGSPEWLAALLAALFLPIVALGAFLVVQGPTYVPAAVVGLYLAASARQVVLVRARRPTKRISSAIAVIEWGTAQRHRG